jgi:hypothetical protein
VKEQLIKIFNTLNDQIIAENNERRESGSRLIVKSKIHVLGQTSLLIQPELTAKLSLAQTGDLDALLEAENFVKETLKKILSENGFVYDEDSPYIFIPTKTKYSNFLMLPSLEVIVIDPESALVSKAVRAPEKNKFLIRQAIASESYPNLAERIIENGGKLTDFI